MPDNILTFLTLWNVWLIIAILLFILEIIVPGFFLACFGVGALISTISALLGFGVVANVIIFCIGSLLSLIFLRPFILKISKNKGAVTGMDALIGRKVLVKEQIDNKHETGLVKIDGDIWQARTTDNSIIEPGEEVEIISYKSLILNVKKI